MVGCCCCCDTWPCWAAAAAASSANASTFACCNSCSCAALACINGVSISAKIQIINHRMWMRNYHRICKFWLYNCIKFAYYIGHLVSMVGANLRPVNAAAADGCRKVVMGGAGGDDCFGFDTFVLLFANSSRIVCGRSGSNLTPCSECAIVFYIQ